MDFNGNPIGANNFDNNGNEYTPPGGTLTVSGNLTVTNDLIVQGTIISDLEVKDSLIYTNVAYPTDNVNAGLCLNNTNDTQFSGILRNGINKEFYLFNNSPTKPTPATPAPSPNAVLNLATVRATSGYLTLKSADNTQTITADNTGTLVYDAAVPRVVALKNSYAGIGSADGLGTLTVDNNLLNYGYNGVARLSVDNAGTVISSQDGATTANISNNLMAFNTSEGEQLRIEPQNVIIDSGGYGIILDDNQANIYSPDGNQAIFTNNSTISFSTSGIGRMYCYTPAGFDDGSFTLAQENVVTPTATKYYMKDDFIKLIVGGKEQLTISTALAGLAAPNGTNKIETDNTSNRVIFNSINRVIADGTGTTIASPSTTTYTTVVDGAAQTVVSGTLREQYTVNNSTIAAPNGTAGLVISNTAASLEAPSGALSLGTNITASVSIGKSGLPTTVNGTLNTTQGLYATGGLVSNALQSSGAMIIGTLPQVDVTISGPGKTTTVAGALLVTETSNLKGATTFGTGGTSYVLPTARGTDGQILKIDGSGVVSFAADSSYSVNFGGNINTNVLRYAIPAAPYNYATNVASDYSTRSVVPYNAVLRVMTYNTQSGSATTQIQIRKGGVVQTTLTLAAASGIFSGLNISFSAGDYIELSWNNVGTRPDNTQFRLFLS